MPLSFQIKPTYYTVSHIVTRDNTQLRMPVNTWHGAVHTKMADSGDMSKSALSFKILAECPNSKARVAKMCLPHHTVDTPVCMPVGTQGTLKAMTPQQLIDLDCQLILGNTYHLGNRPVSSQRIRLQ